MATKIQATGGKKLPMAKKEARAGRRKTASAGWAAQIMDAPQGVRVVSHSEIKAAVAKVFREREGRDG